MQSGQNPNRPKGYTLQDAINRLKRTEVLTLVLIGGGVLWLALIAEPMIQAFTPVESPISAFNQRSERGHQMLRQSLIEASEKAAQEQAGQR